MKKSLGSKICWIGTLLIVAFVLMNMILTYFFMAPFSTLFYREQMSDLGDSIEKLNMTDEQEFDDRIDEIDDQYGVKVTVIDGDKNILHTTRTVLKPESNYWRLSMEVFDSDRTKIDAGKNVFLTRNRQQRNNKKTIQLIMIQKIDEDQYVVMSKSYQSLQNAMYSAIIFELVAGIVIIFLGWIVVYRLSRYMVVPIRKMTVTAEQISNLKFDSKVDVTSMDEIGQLGVSINKMSERLEMNMMELQEDIEKRKRLVRNLSHEIKSPIAVIMGYADRMKAIIDKKPEKAIEYCEIISNESARVDVLVKEMLEFSKMEQKVNALNIEEIELKDLFLNLEKRFHEENFETNIHLTMKYDDTAIVKADYMLLERAIYNLMNNAVAHGGDENMQIQVNAITNEEYYEFKVFNTGSHIHENEIASIWEPFNKVDKVRMRGSHGYGVGLSIVREIVESHHGYCKVENKENGVEFVIAIHHK